MALGMLNGLSLPEKREDADYYHKVMEAIKLAFADTKTYVADPRYMKTQVSELLDPAYLAARRALPDYDFYEDFPQLENGVGMLRLQQTEFRSALSLSDPPDGVPFSMAAGVSAAPFLEKLLCTAQEKYATIKGHVYAIENDFFGRSINVSGLITGQDLIAQLRGKDLGERLLISNNMVRHDELDFLDDITLAQASAALGVPIYPVAADGFALCDAMFGILPEVHLPDRGNGSTDGAEYYKYNPHKEG